MPDVLDRLLSRYARPVPGEPTLPARRGRTAPTLSVESHKAAAVFLRSIAAMHETSSAELLIGLANYHLQQAAAKS